jgi:multidrug transporter EmrE-like cation transporter
VVNYLVLKQKLQLKSVLAGILLGILNFLSTYYFFKGVETIESAIFFPVLNTGIVSLSALIGYFVFKEQLNKINWLGIVIALGTIVFIAFAK